MVLAEALAHGLPIVASTAGAADETLPDPAALKVPPGDAVALAERSAAPSWTSAAEAARGSGVEGRPNPAALVRPAARIAGVVTEVGR